MNNLLETLDTFSKIHPNLSVFYAVVLFYAIVFIVRDIIGFFLKTGAIMEINKNILEELKKINKKLK